MLMLFSSFLSTISKWEIETMFETILSPSEIDYIRLLETISSRMLTLGMILCSN